MRAMRWWPQEGHVHTLWFSVTEDWWPEDIPRSDKVLLAACPPSPPERHIIISEYRRMLSMW